MQQRALAGRELAVDRVAHERVDEAQRRVGPQDLRAGQLARRGRDGLLLESGERRHGGHLGVLAQHADRARDRDGVAREAAEADEHRARRGAGPDRAHDRGVGGDGLDALGLERSQELAEQQRVAAGRGVAGVAERGLGRLAEPLAHQRLGAHAAQRAGLDGPRVRVVGDLGEQRRVGARLAAAHGHRQQDRQPFEPSREVGEEAQRRPVAPVEVVDGEQQRLLGREVRGEPEEPVERGERRHAAAVGPRREVGRAEDGGRRCGRAGERLRAARRIGHGRLEQLAHDAEAELALELRRAGGQHEQLVARTGAQVGEQARLADPGRAADHEQPPAPRRRVGDRGVERRDLGLALDQRHGARARSASSRRERMPSLR